MDAWIHFNEQVRNPVWISCALKANLPRCMYIFSTPISSGLLCSSTVDSQSLNNLMSFQFYVLYWHSSSLLYRFLCMLLRPSCLLACHNDGFWLPLWYLQTGLIDAGKNKWLFAPISDMDRLRVLYVSLSNTHFFYYADNKLRLLSWHKRVIWCTNGNT
jgi:hypothetical protein